MEIGMEMEMEMVMVMVIVCLMTGARECQRQGSLDPDIVTLLEKTSAFLGKSESMVDGTNRDLHEFDDRCKLCFRTFSMFNRKQQCSSCRDVVCSSCLNSRNVGMGMAKGVTSNDSSSDSVKQRVCQCCVALLCKSTADGVTMDAGKYWDHDTLV